MLVVDTPQFRDLIRWWKGQTLPPSLGMVGTANGFSRGQAAGVKSIFNAMRDHFPLVHFHHCDRIGAETEAHAMAWEIPSFRVVIHPHLAALYRARNVGHDVRPAWPAFRATEDMIDECQLILAVPFSSAEFENVHAWDACALARAKRKALLVLPPEPSSLRRGA